MAQYSVSTDHAESTSASVSPLGMSALALTTFILGASNASLFKGAAIIGLVFFFGGLIQLLVGLRSSHTAFASYGGFWMAYGASYLMPVASGTQLSYFFLAWTIFAGIVLLSTWHGNLVHMGIFLFFFLTFLGLTIAAFGGGSIFTTIAGWLGIITAILAWYTSLASLGSPFHLPYTS